MKKKINRTLLSVVSIVIGITLGCSMFYNTCSNPIKNDVSPQVNLYQTINTVLGSHKAALKTHTETLLMNRSEIRDLQFNIDRLVEKVNVIGEYYNGKEWIKYTKNDIEQSQQNELKINGRWYKEEDIFNYDRDLYGIIRKAKLNFKDKFSTDVILEKLSQEITSLKRQIKKLEQTNE